MHYIFKINGESFIALKNNIYFDKKDKEFAIFLLDIEEKFKNDIINNKQQIKINLTSGITICHFILDIGIYKFAFELLGNPNIETIRNMINNKELEIGFAFQDSNENLIHELCFTVDY